MPWFSPDADALLSVVAATLDLDGTLVEANGGFRRIAPCEKGARAARFFVRPDFATLARTPPGPDGEVYRGLMTIGEYEGNARSLRGRVRRTGDRLALLAEYDIDAIERLNEAVLELNRDCARAELDVARMNLKLRQREAEIAEMARTDPLTGVGNRRRLDEALELELARAARTGDGLCAIMADLDRFKQVNDAYGHDIGDRVLAELGALLRHETRTTDCVARFGGEEFVVLMPHARLDQAAILAERIRARFEACRVEPIAWPVTLSLGVVEWRRDEDGAALLHRADRALYAAKQHGRNRVVAASD